MTALAALLLRYFPGLPADRLKMFEALQPLYEEWNSRINVISRKDIEHLAVRHVLHSLAIARFISFAPGSKVTDIGTGGGFPGIPLAIFFPEVQFHLVDSIGKKVTVAGRIAEALALDNVRVTKARAEELSEQADFAVSRAVSTLADLLQWSRPLVSRHRKNVVANGLICLKGGDLETELKAAGKGSVVVNLSDYFEEDFFATKKLVYVPF